MGNTSAITAVNMFSMKPLRSAIANRHLHGSGEKNGEQWKTKVNFGRTMMQALELLQLAKRYVLG